MADKDEGRGAAIEANEDVGSTDEGEEGDEEDDEEEDDEEGDEAFAALSRRPPHLLSGEDIAKLKLSLLYKLDKLERMGMCLPRNHSMASDYREMLYDYVRMQAEYDNICKKKECEDLMQKLLKGEYKSEDGVAPELKLLKLLGVPVGNDRGAASSK